LLTYPDADLAYDVLSSIFNYFRGAVKDRSLNLFFKLVYCHYGFKLDCHTDKNYLAGY